MLKMKIACIALLAIGAWFLLVGKPGGSRAGATLFQNQPLLMK
jgi:hypothetical protein